MNKNFLFRNPYVNTGIFSEQLLNDLLSKGVLWIVFDEKFHPEFSGYIWESNGGVWISFIKSKQEGKGHFRKFLDELKEKYLYLSSIFNVVDFLKVNMVFGIDIVDALNNITVDNSV